MPDLALKVFKEFETGPNEILMAGSFIAMANKWDVEWSDMLASIEAGVSSGLVEHGKASDVFKLTQAGYDKIHA